MVWCFGNIFRFIDELTAFNACDEFEGSCNEIYPSKLELKKENIGYLVICGPYDHYKRWKIQSCLIRGTVLHLQLLACRT